MSFFDQITEDNINCVKVDVTEHTVKFYAAGVYEYMVIKTDDISDDSIKDAEIEINGVTYDIMYVDKQCCRLKIKGGEKIKCHNFTITRQDCREFGLAEAWSIVKWLKDGNNYGLAPMLQIFNKFQCLFFFK